MNNRSIGLIDSGVGGFTVLKVLQDNFPDEDIIYYGDSKNMPYGEKSNEEIIELVNQDIKFLEDQGVKIIVLACNTASSLIDRLESKVKLFSIIEAGCEAVLDSQSSGPVGLIATRATVNNKAYDKMIPAYSQELEFISYGTPTLAQVINNNLNEINLLKKNITLAIEPILERFPIKNLLLGCTHYPIVSETIRELYPHIWLIDPAQKMSDIVDTYLEENELYSPPKENNTTNIFITGKEIDLKRSEALLEELDISYDALTLLD